MAARAFFYAQPYTPAGRGVEAGRALQCVTAAEAIGEAERLAVRATGAVACRIDGDPQSDVWLEPVKLASYGRVR